MARRKGFDEPAAVEAVYNPTLTDRIADFLNPTGEAALTRAMMERFRPAAFYGLRGPTLNFDEDVMMDTPDVPSSALVLNPKNLPTILERMADLAKVSPLRNADLDLGGIENSLAKLYMRAQNPRFTSQAPIFEDTMIGDLEVGRRRRPLYNLNKPSVYRDYIARSSPEKMPELSSYYDIERDVLTLGSNPQRLSDPAAAIGEAMWALRSNRPGAKLPSYKKQNRQIKEMGDVARKSYERFLTLLEEQFGALGASRVLRSFLGDLE